MSLALALSAVAVFSVFAFWKLNAVLFMLAGGASIMLGLYWYDVYTTDVGLGISLMLIMYSFICLAFAYSTLLWRGRRDG